MSFMRSGLALEQGGIEERAEMPQERWGRR